MQVGTEYTDLAGMCTETCATSIGETLRSLSEPSEGRRKDPVGLPVPQRQEVLANQPDTVVVDKKWKTAVVTDTAFQSDSNINKKHYD